MELVFPGIWTLVGFFGILSTLTGSTLLAFNQLSAVQNNYRQKMKEEFGQEAHSGLKSIAEGREELSSGPEFMELNIILTKEEVINRLDLPLTTEEELKEIGFHRYDPQLNYRLLYMIGEDEEKYSRLIPARHIKQEIDRDIDRRLKNIQDKAVRTSWEILAFGFFLQTLSYFARNFIVV